MEKVYDTNVDTTVPYWAGGNLFSHLTFMQLRNRVLMRVTGDRTA
jgi:hypothetical protein